MNASRPSPLRALAVGALLVSLLGVFARAQDRTLDNKYDPVLRGLRSPSITVERLRAIAKRHGVDPTQKIVSVFIEVKAGTHPSDLRAADSRVKVHTESNRILTADLPLDALDKVAALPGVVKIHLSHKLKPVNDVARSTQTTNSYPGANADWFLGMQDTASVSGYGNFTGTGVVIGDVDTGLDVHHPDFMTGTRGTGSAASRVLFYWDQTSGNSVLSGGQSPTVSCTGNLLNGNSTCDGYGTEWTNAQMTSDARNTACVTSNAAAPMTSFSGCVVRSSDTVGHGTAVLGCAAGNGNGTNGSVPAGTYAGIAPNADLIMVESDLADAHTCDGVSYIFAEAAAKGEPAVANLSIGGHFGPHDGTSPLEQCLAGLNNNGNLAGRVIVAAAGNEGEDYIHAQINSGGADTGGAVYFTNNDGWGNAGPEYLNFWHDPGDSYNITVTIYNVNNDGTRGSQIGATAFDANTFADPDENNWPTLGASDVVAGVDNYGTATDCANDAFSQCNDDGSTASPNEIVVLLDPTFNGDGNPYFYSISFSPQSTGGSNHKMDGWIAQYAGIPGYTFAPQFNGSGGDNNESVGMPGSSPYVITAGAYISKISWVSANPSGSNPQCNGFLDPAPLAIGSPASSPCSVDLVYLGDIAPFSSLGPARGGATKPDVASPGNLIVTSLSQTSPSDFGPADQNFDLFHGETSGTSFATPFTSGAAALRLQQNPNLTTAQVKSALQSVARQDGATAGAANYFTGENGTIANTWGAGKTLATPPAYPAPSGVAAVATASGTVHWTWGDISNEDGYRVRASSNNSVIASLPANTTFYDQAAPTPNALTQDYIEAYNAAGSTTTIFVRRYSAAATPLTLVRDSADSTSVTISWNADGNPAGTVYQVEQSQDQFQTNVSTPVPFSSGLVALSTTISGLTSGTAYYYRVRAQNSDSIATAPSNIIVGEQGNTPAAVTLSTAALGYSSITWTWTFASVATGYYVLNGETGALLATESIFTDSYTVTALGVNAPYDLEVAGVNQFGEGLLSGNTAYTLALTPTAPTVLGVSTSTVSLSWTANGNPAGTPFELSMSLDGFTANFSTPIAFSSGFTTTSYSVSGLASGTTYYFRLRSENGGGVPTPFTTQASTGTNPTPPPGTVVTGFALGVSSITWTWNPLIPPATAYNLYSGSGNSLGSTGATTFTGTGLSTNTAYDLQVAGVNVIGQGPLAGATVYTEAAVPLSPVPVSLSVNGAGLSWNAAGNPAGTPYQLQVSADPTFTVAVATAGTTGTSASVTGLTPNTTYNLEVQAHNGNGIGTMFTAPIATPTWAALPTGLTFTQVSSAAVAVSWSGNANPSDTPYELSLSTDLFVLSDSTPLPFAAVPGLSVTLSGLVASTTYYVRLRAENRAGIITSFSSATYFLAPELVLDFAAGQGGTLVFGPATLVVPPGAFSRPVTLTLQNPGVLPAPNSYTGPLTPTQSGVEISAGGVQPAKNPTLTLAYTPGGAITDPTRLVIAYYDPVRAVWVPQESTPNPSAHTVTAAIPHFSLYQVMQENPAASLSSAHILAFPDPVYTSRGQQMNFSGLPAGASLTVYTFRGDKVRTFDANASGLAVWDGRNDAGSAAASGVYMVLVKSGGDTTVLKVMVER